MADKIKDVLDATKTRERTQGFVTALFIIVFILTTVDFLGAIEFRTLPKSDWTSPDAIWGFPSSKNPEYRLFINCTVSNQPPLFLHALAHHDRFC